MLTHRTTTILGDIPSDWQRELLDELLATHRGGEWGDENGDVGIRVLRSTNFTNRGILDFSDIALRYFPQMKALDFQLEENDILLERSGGGPTQPVGRVGLIRQRLPGHWFSNFVQMLRPNSEKIDAVFLGWLLLRLNRSGFVERLQHQTTQMRNLDFRDYLRVYLPLPSRLEQQQIGRVLQVASDSLDAVTEKVQSAQQVKAALLQQLFSHGLPNRHTHFQKTKWTIAPACWKPRQLRDIADVEAGFTMGRDLSGSDKVEVSYLTVINVQHGRFDLSDVARVEVKVSELEGLLLRDGDVLMTEGGDRDKLGRGAMWRNEITPCVYQNHIFRIRLRPDTYIPQLFHFLLQTWQARNYFYAHAKQTSNLCTINSRELKRFPFCEPSPKEQEQMILLLSKADEQLLQIQDEMQALEKLTTALLQNLLIGRVRLRD
jgi:type I restriction enzyme, S subunit